MAQIENAIYNTLCTRM